MRKAVVALLVGLAPVLAYAAERPDWAFPVTDKVQPPVQDDGGVKTAPGSDKAYTRKQMPQWKETYTGVEEMKLAVMGCVVNGPGESKHANIGISLPGTFEEPKAPVYVDGRLFTTLKGDNIVPEFIKILDEYVDSHYAAAEKKNAKEQEVAAKV